VDRLLVDIIEFLRAAGPEVVYFVALVETAFFVGLLVPAEATVLVASFFVAEGIFRLEHVLLATILGGLTGDQLGYALGRFGGRRATVRSGWLGRVWAQHEPRATAMFGRHPIIAVSLARFVSFVRTLMPWFAGMTRMRYPRFFVYDLLGVTGWGAASVMAGYLAGESWHILAGALGTASAVIVALLVIALIVVIRRGRGGSAGEAASAQDAAGPPTAGPTADGESATPGGTTPPAGGPGGDE